MKTLIKQSSKILTNFKEKEIAETMIVVVPWYSTNWGQHCRRDIYLTSMSARVRNERPSWPKWLWQRNGVSLVGLCSPVVQDSWNQSTTSELAKTMSRSLKVGKCTPLAPHMFKKSLWENFEFRRGDDLDVATRVEYSTTSSSSRFHSICNSITGINRTRVSSKTKTSFSKVNTKKVLEQVSVDLSRPMVSP